LLGNDDESAALQQLCKNNNNFSIYLFNEACANCAWTTGSLAIGQEVIFSLEEARIDDPNPDLYVEEIGAALEHIRRGELHNIIKIGISVDGNWRPLRSHFILNGVRTAALNLLVDNEGTHQEQLAHALLGNLSPSGAYPNSQLHEPSGKKEFIDILVTYEFGTILLESKTLSIFDQRNTLPNRQKLRKNIQKSAERARKQLEVAARKLRKGVTVFDENGNVIRLERMKPPHCILLVPELDLLTEESHKWLSHIVHFMKSTGAFLHVLDTVQLFRMMQAAEMIAKASKSTTLMMAFDYYLIQRAEAVASRRSINFDMILRLHK